MPFLRPLFLSWRCFHLTRVFGWVIVIAFFGFFIAVAKIGLFSPTGCWLDDSRLANLQTTPLSEYFPVPRLGTLFLISWVRVVVSWSWGQEWLSSISQLPCLLLAHNLFFFLPFSYCPPIPRLGILTLLSTDYCPCGLQKNQNKV